MGTDFFLLGVVIKYIVNLYGSSFVPMNLDIATPLIEIPYRIVSWSRSSFSDVMPVSRRIRTLSGASNQGMLKSTA